MPEEDGAWVVRETSSSSVWWIGLAVSTEHAFRQTDKKMLQKGVLVLFMWARVRCSMVAVCTHGGF